MESEGLSGEILEPVGIIHQRDCEGHATVGEDILFVVARDLKRETMSVHIYVDHFVIGVSDVDLRIRKQALSMSKKVVVISIGHDDGPNYGDHHLIKITLSSLSGKTPVKSEVSLDG
jgi:hypothetical protein